MYQGVNGAALLLGAFAMMMLLGALVAITGCLVLLVIRLRRASSGRPADLWQALLASGFFRSWWFEAALFFPALTAVSIWAKRYFEGG